MDNILDKLGLYDFFGLLLPGMFFMVVLDLIDFPLISSFTYPDSEVFVGIAFVVVSYICGTIMQEIASYIDQNITKIRENAIEEILSDKKLSESECKKIRKLINDLSKDEVGDEPKDEKNHDLTGGKFHDAFFKCKEYLEDKGKMEKANKLDAIFAMSRDFTVCNFLLSICVFMTIVKYNAYTFYNLLFQISLIGSIFVFDYRAKRYAKMRVRNIFRRYITCHESNNYNFFKRVR